MKRIFCIILMLSLIAVQIPVTAEQEDFSLVSGEATIKQIENGAEIEYISGTPCLSYTLPQALEGIVSAEFDLSLNAAQLKNISAYSDSGSWMFYIESSRNIWGSTLNNKGTWITESVGYDISEYSSSKCRLIINNEENTYSLYVDGLEVIKDFKFINNGDAVKKLQFTFGEPIATKGAVAVISGMVVRNTTAEELKTEEFGNETDIKYSEEDKVKIYVSPAGDDQNSGTIEKPFKTISAAKDYANKIKTEKGLPKNGIDIILRAGEYNENIRLKTEDSGKENAPIRFLAYTGENVKISGMKKIDSGLLEMLSDENISSQLPENAQGRVYKLSLKEAGIENKIEIAAMGQLGIHNPSTAIITVNGKAAKVASWPNEGYATVKNVEINGIITVDYDKMSKWQNLNYAWLHTWVNGWYDGSVRAEYDAEYNGIKTKNSLAHGGIQKGSKIRLVNILEELDSPGEWYLDPEKQEIYIWPEDDPENSEVEITAQKESLLKISGAKYITFENIDFEGSSANGATLNKALNIEFLGCRFENIGKRALEINDCEKCIVKSCDIKNTGRGGISLSGGDSTTLKKAENYVMNTHISNFSKETKTSAAAVKISGVGNYVVNNLINDGEHTAISFSGNLNVIDKNEIYNVMTEADDAGAIYGGRSFVNRGNVISNNFIHGISHGASNNRMGIYLDDHLCGTEVTGNIIYDCNTAVLLHGGRDNIVKNNLSVECDQAVKAIDWTYKDYLDDESYSMWQELDKSAYKSELWQNKFAHLYNIKEDEPKEAKYNVVSGNLAVDCKSGNTAVEIYRNYSEVINNIDTADRGVVEDIENFNFRLNENTDVFKENNFLINNQYGEMGLYSDEYRTSFEKLGEVKLAYPQDKAERIALDNVEFYWDKAENAGEYIFTLAEDSEFKKVISQEKLYGKNYISVSGLKDNGCKYYWRVTAVLKTSDTRETKESEIYSFRTKVEGGMFYEDNFDGNIVPDGYSIGSDEYDKLSVLDGKLIYERPLVEPPATTGVYRDVDIDLSKIKSEKLVIEYDVYPEKVRVDEYLMNFPLVTDTSGKKYVYNYYDKDTRDLNSSGQEAQWHWYTSFTPWNAENASELIYKMKLEIDTKNNKQSLYTAAVPVGFEGEPEYIGYSNKAFAEANTDGTIKRIYLAKPGQWNSVKILFDNFKVYEYIPLEITSISNPNGAVLMNNTPKIDITFNSRIDEDTLYNITLKNGMKKAEFKPILNSEDSISLCFEEALEWGEEYTLTIPESVANIYRQGLEKEVIYTFKIRENPTPEKNIIRYDDFNNSMPSGYSWSGHSSESVMLENGILKYKKSDTCSQQLDGLKKSINIDMNTLPKKTLTIEYDLYTYGLYNKDIGSGTGWLMGFPELTDENGKKYFSFYYETPGNLVKYFKTDEAHEVGKIVYGDDVMYRVKLGLNMETGRYSAEFKRFNTQTGNMEDSFNVSEDAFLENTSGKLGDFTIIKGYIWDKFEIGIDNFSVYCDNSVLYSLETDGKKVTAIEKNKEYSLIGEINDGNLNEFKTILVQYDKNEKLLSTFIVNKQQYEEGKINKIFVSDREVNKIKIFTWNEQKPVSGIYEWKEVINE